MRICIDVQRGSPLPEGLYAGVAPETLVIAGGKSPEYMRNAQASLAAALPDARCALLPGQTHMLKADAAAPVVSAFLAG